MIESLLSVFLRSTIGTASLHQSTSSIHNKSSILIKKEYNKNNLPKEFYFGNSKVYVVFLQSANIYEII